MKFEHADGKFWLSSRATLSRFLGAAFVVTGAAFLTLTNQPFMLLLTVLFIGGGGAMILQPDVTTEFDLRECSVNVWYRYPGGTEKTVKVPFGDVASIGLARWQGGGESVDTYVVELTLKNGSRCQLSSRFTENLNEQLEEVRTSAGFERHDRNATFSLISSRTDPS